MTSSVNPAQYVVLDVETNGTNSKEDDLLSISVYKPDDGRTFNRFLPLEKQGFIKPGAYAVNGIMEGDLKGTKPLSQTEVDNLIREFELDKRTILCYGGGRGRSKQGFDERFLRQYFSDHRLDGIDVMRFFNFKTLVFASPNRFFPASKDNLCIAFGINGVTTVHTSANDCVLEWRLFEAMDGDHLLVTNGNVFRLKDGYIFPASYIDSFPGLGAYAGVPKRYVTTEKVFELDLSPDATSKLPKFANNFSGNAIEHLIDSEMQARRVDSGAFLLSNKKKLEYVGSFPGTVDEVRTERRDGGVVALSSSTYDHAIAELRKTGSFEALVDALVGAKQNGGFSRLLAKSRTSFMQLMHVISSKEYGELSEEMRSLYKQSLLTDAITEANEKVKPELSPLIDFLRGLLGNDVLSQELVVNARDNCLALCDLSSVQAVVEIKAGRLGYDLQKCSNQLYYCANGRDCYALHVEWGESGCNTKFIVDRITFSEERPFQQRRRSEKMARKYRIRHAVTDWRAANANGNVHDCASALWLDADEVEAAWSKTDPSVLFNSIPVRGRSRQTFETIVAWRNANPDGTRLELVDSCGIPIGDVEKWWFGAELCGGTAEKLRSIRDRSDESIRSTIEDLADEANLYATWSDEQVSDLQDRVKALCLKAGMPTGDLTGRALFLWSPRLFEGQSRKTFVCELLKTQEQCKKEIRSGTKALRIPLACTRYKTRACFMELDPRRARIAFSTVCGKVTESINITASERKAVTIRPGDALYGAAKKLVGKKVIRIFIERPDDAADGQLVLAVSRKRALNSDTPSSFAP